MNRSVPDRKNTQALVSQRWLLFYVFIFTGVFLGSCHGTGDTRPVFGTDTREELVSGGPLLCRAGSATVAIFRRDVFMEPTASGQWHYRQRAVLESDGWCGTVRFAQQDAQAYCTGFLIAPDRIATAGHCINAENDVGYAPDCSEVLIVFDYRMGIDGLAPTAFAGSSVFHCDEVLDGRTASIGADWRVISLDRPSSRQPLSMFSGSNIPDSAELVVIGHPLGLPMKSATGRILEKTDMGSQSTFLARIDTFEGNSGSPVLIERNDQLEVVGLLTSGYVDSKRVSGLGGCKQTLVCKNANDCGRGEMITANTPLLRWTQFVESSQAKKNSQAPRCAWCQDPLRSRHWQCAIDGA